MSNNIGLIGASTKLPRTIGDTLAVSDTQLITSITGELDLGFILFDSDGTMGVCTTFSRDDQNNPVYTFRTVSLNTEIDITSILSQSY